MTNSNLITVFNGQIATQSVQLCNARELHTFLEVKNRFNDWINDRISDYGFIQDEDYIIVHERTNGRPRKEYHITLDMGKELAMVERNEKGRQIRKYFIECERRAKQPQQLALPDEQLPLSLRKKKYAKELTEEQWLRLASMWFALYNTIDLLKQIHQPLEMLGSRHGVTAYTHASEYQRTLGVMKRILEPLLAEFDVDPREEAHYHKALQTLRNYKPTGLGAIARI